MGFLSNLFGREQRARVDDPVFWQHIFTNLGAATKSNQTVTPEASSALKSTTTYACVRVLAETIASLPLMIYRRNKGGGKEPAQEHYLYTILHDSPNMYQSSFEFREMQMGHLCLRGNAFTYKEIDGGGRIVNLYPLNPARMTVKRNKSQEIIYEYIHDDGKIEQISSEYIWHPKGLSSDGIMGLCPISLVREAIGLGLSAEEHEARLMANAVRPSGVLEYPGRLQEDARKTLKDSFQEGHTGENIFKTMLLEGGLKWTQVGMKNVDAQFLELRNFQVEDICRVFRVPAVLVQHPDKSATYASAEQFFLSFVVHTIRPWTVRIEQSANKSLLTEKERKKYFIEHKLDGLLRGDISARYKSYEIGIKNGWLSANDIRELENMNPRIGGDEYYPPIGSQSKGGEGNATAST
uniref:Putative portal protein n=1 Tax=viral metagenome TaxID=1070528 RepID=A0A6M3JR02_9ZZZZ